ncbi:hypothetical protein NE865_08775 [Phthorimaea operculella]|nr:hypothetical protein NE865_08775 [Phthorimaea operculella]
MLSPTSARADSSSAESAVDSSSPSPAHLANHVQFKQSLQAKSYGGNNRQRFKKDDVVMYKKNIGNGKFVWRQGIIVKTFGKVTYLIKDVLTGQKCKKHKNQVNLYKGNLGKSQNGNWVEVVDLLLDKTNSENQQSRLWEGTVEDSSENPPGGGEEMAETSDNATDDSSSEQAVDTVNEDFLDAETAPAIDPVEEETQRHPLVDGDSTASAAPPPLQSSDTEDQKKTAETNRSRRTRPIVNYKPYL